jgi:hypothetical protein
LQQLQICLYSTEHLSTLGRVEKRTIFYGDIGTFFGNNDVVLEKVILAASRTTNDIPFITRFLSHEDRWHIMNIVINRISALFGPFHVFFNEARRNKSYFHSAWYLYTITCQQNIHHGRFFVTPYKPVLSRVDMGVKRLRIDLVNENEMRDICSGVILPPSWGFFNNRHKYRWEILLKMSELFENQLVIIDKSDLSPAPEEQDSIKKVESRGLLFEDGHEQDCRSDDGSGDEGDAPPSSPSSWQSIKEPNEELTPNILRKWSPDNPERHTSNPREKAQEATRCGRKCDKTRSKETDNCIMRVHIPFPGAEASSLETRDVVLFE